MKEKYAKLQILLKDSLYFKGNLDEWIENMKKLFDQWFDISFDETRKLGNEQNYNINKDIYNLLLLDFATLRVEYQHDFFTQQIELFKLTEDLDVLLKSKIIRSSIEIYHKSITYQAYFMAVSILRLSNIETIQSKKYYEEFVDIVGTISAKASKKVLKSNGAGLQEGLESTLLETKVKKAKLELGGEGKKITLTEIAKKLGKPITTLQDQLNKYKIKWREV